MTDASKKAATLERFWSKTVLGVTPTSRPGLGPCVLWVAATSNGYGRFHDAENRMCLAHRWLYETVAGPLPSDVALDHLCRVRNCVNIRHLEPVDNMENQRRGAKYALRNGMRTACVNGHEYTPGNTYLHERTGKIYCRECQRLSSQRRRARSAALKGGRES